METTLPPPPTQAPETPVTAPDGGEPQQAAQTPEAPAQPPVEDIAALKEKLDSQRRINEALQREQLKGQQGTKKLQAELEDLRQKWELVTKDPLTGLEKAGHTYKGITEQILKSGQADPQASELQKIKAELDAIKAEAEEGKTAKQKAEEQAARSKKIETFRGEVDAREDLTHVSSAGMHEYLLDQIEGDEDFQLFANAGDVESQRRRAAQIAHRVETEVEQMLQGQFGTLLKKSPKFRSAIEAMLQEATGEGSEGEAAEATGTLAPESTEQATATQPSNKARPRTITRSQQTAVNGRTANPGGIPTREQARARLKARLDQLEKGQ